jgi:hypothetical protein
MFPGAVLARRMLLITRDSQQGKQRSAASISSHMQNSDAAGVSYRVVMMVTG